MNTFYKEGTEVSTNIFKVDHNDIVEQVALYHKFQNILQLMYFTIGSSYL